ncbi:hypothetical protein VUR80DRAFT_8143 [Thermomyces stellatus]
MSSLLYSPVIDIAAKLGGAVLSPFLSGPLLLSATYYPEAVRDALASVSAHLPDALSTYLSLPGLLDSPRFMTGLKVLVGLGVVNKLNQGLNAVAHNSWRLCAAKGWDNWADEVAVVTGGSSGIGNDIVRRLAALEIRVAVFDIADLPKEMDADGARVRFYRCDVTSAESVAAAAEAVRRDLGHPTILVNNAGIANPAPILKTSVPFLHKIMGVNLMSMWYTTQQFLPNMVQNNKGHVVTVASIASFVALATAAPYSATKAGALAFHEALAAELKHQYKAPNVLTSVVHPNFVRTPLVADFSQRLENAGVRMLTADVIAKAVVDQVKSKRGGQLIIPDSASGISGIRGWPTWLQEIIRDAVARGAVKP